MNCDSCGKGIAVRACPVCGGHTCVDCYDKLKEQCDFCTHVEDNTELFK